jgi:TolB protein
MRRMLFKVVYAGLALLLAAYAVSPTSAEIVPRADDVIRFRITNPGQALYKVAVPTLLGDPASAAVLQEVISSDLSLAGFFKVLDPKSFVADLAKEELGMSPDPWKTVGAESVVKGRVAASGSDLSVEFRLFEVVRGENSVLTKNYRAPSGDVRKLGHLFAAEIVRYFTGEDSFFATQIAFARSHGKQQELSVMDWDGAAVRSLTSNGSQNYMPSWHPSGTKLLYTGFARGTPDLWQVAVGGGRPARISTRPGLNTGGVFSPDGSKIAATLSFEGNAEIYLLSPGGDVVKRLTNNPAIDSSPSFSPDGGQIAFMSDRFSNPQIWVMSSSGAGQTRLTKKGSYNQEPVWSPRPVPTPGGAQGSGQSLIAFTGRDDKGNLDIFTINPASGELQRLTENRGSNSHPSWAPNSRAIAYKSSRGGIFVATFDGKTERQVYRGSAETPSWGPIVTK